MGRVYVLKCTILGTGGNKPEQLYTFRDLLGLARFYQNEMGFDKETVHAWLNIARSYWKEAWEGMQERKNTNG